MKTSGNQSFPRWVFAILAVCGLVVSGIFIGIMSSEGISGTHLAQAVGFGLLGLLMFWGVWSKR